MKYFDGEKRNILVRFIRDREYNICMGYII